MSAKGSTAKIERGRKIAFSEKTSAGGRHRAWSEKPLQRERKRAARSLWSGRPGVREAPKTNRRGNGAPAEDKMREVGRREGETIRGRKGGRSCRDIHEYLWGGRGRPTENVYTILLVGRGKGGGCPAEMGGGSHRRPSFFNRISLNSFRKHAV